MKVKFYEALLFLERSLVFKDSCCFNSSLEFMALRKKHLGNKFWVGKFAEVGELGIVLRECVAGELTHVLFVYGYGYRSCVFELVTFNNIKVSFF